MREAVNQEEKLDAAIHSDPSSEAAWRSVVHRLSASVGLIRSAEPEFSKMSDAAREIVEDGVGRLLKLIGTCVENQDRARSLNFPSREKELPLLGSVPVAQRASPSSRRG